MNRNSSLSLLIALTILVAACGGGAPTAVPTSGDTSPQKGGEITVVYKDDLATLDPAIGYDWTNWPTIKLVFDGLLDYDEGTAIMPRLAESLPSVSADGLTYTFKLRKGVKFTNGREFAADDVVYTITRVLDPKTGSPGAGFFVGIQGAQEFMDGTATSVEGVKALDANTVQFTLASPDVTFLNKMALNFAFIVPKEEVEKEGENFGHKPTGTGPYMLKEWKSGEFLVFERNPNYFFEGRPYIDKITIQVGVAPDVALVRLEKGEIHMLGGDV